MKISVLAAAMLLSCASATHAQDFPTRPITIMVGVAPGGVTDLATRAYANAVSKNTGWKVVVENRTGAGGAVAAKAVEVCCTGRIHAADGGGRAVCVDPGDAKSAAVRSG